MADKVKPDADFPTAFGVAHSGQPKVVKYEAIFLRSTILRVIDEEIAEIDEFFDAMEVDPWNVDEHRHRIDTLRSLRARFEEDI